VTCGQVFSPERQDLAQEEIKLDLLVAGNAGVGRPPLRILATEVVNHMTLELRLEIEDVEGDAKKLTYPTSVIGIPM
jgi:hypothetical protein